MSRTASGLFILLGVLALVALAWMAFLPSLVEHELSSRTGFDVRIQSLAANPFTGRLAVHGLVARNPPGYPAPDFVEVRGIAARADLLESATSGRIVLEDLDLDVAKVELVRRRDGPSNADSFSRGLSGPPAPAGSASTSRGFLIRSLHVRLDRLVIADADGARVSEHDYPLRIDQRYRNVTDTRQLLLPGMVSYLYSEGVRGSVIASLLPDDFGAALSGALGARGDELKAGLKQAQKKARDFFRGALDKLEQTAKP